MRVNVKIGSVTSLTGRHCKLSISAACLPSESGYDRLKPGLQARFELNDAAIPLVIASVSHRNSDGPSLLLTSARDLRFLTELFSVQGQEVAIFIAEDAPRDLLDEASALLKCLAVREKRPESQLLQEITAFKPSVRGHKDIEFVSERQLPVVIRKLKERLQSPAKSADAAS
jgi:hypothetical protein